MKSQEFVIKCINSICKTFHTLYNLNWGGCCYMAYIIASFLEQNNIPFTIVFIDSDKSFNNFNDVDISVSHVSIKVKNTMLNYSKSYKKFKHSEFSNITSKDILKYYNKVSWCNIYSKAQNLFIKSVFNKMMNHAIY